MSLEDNSSINTISILLHIPFIFCDLYYGYSNDECLYENILNMSIKLKDILIIFGYQKIISFIFLLHLNGATKLFGANALFSFCLSLFNMSWTIVAAISIFGDTELFTTCGSSLYTYLTFTTILGLIGILGFIPAWKPLFKYIFKQDTEYEDENEEDKVASFHQV